MRSVQEGSFLRSGGVPVVFTQAVNGNRIDISLARGADATGASGTGVLSAILFDAIAPGPATLTLSGTATGPGGAAMGLQVRTGDGDGAVDCGLVDCGLRVGSGFGARGLHVRRAARRRDDRADPGVGDHAAGAGDGDADARGRAAARRCARSAPRSTSTRTRPTSGRSARSIIKVGSENYPPDLQTLVDGVTAANDATGRKLKYLRHIPVDPMTRGTEWGMRSYQDKPDSTRWGGQNVFDVYTTLRRHGARRHEVQGLVGTMVIGMIWRMRSGASQSVASR